MAYISSDNIQVFPSAKRGVTYYESRLTTEAAFVNIVNKLIDSVGFVISSEYSADADFEFNIYGYYFKINPASDIVKAVFEDSRYSPNVGNTIYAYINLTSLAGNLELAGTDDSDTSEYQGLILTNEVVSTTDSIKCVKLLTCETAGTWTIPSDSLAKFDSTSINLVVDGGEI